MQRDSEITVALPWVMLYGHPRHGPAYCIVVLDAVEVCVKTANNGFFSPLISAIPMHRRGKTLSFHTALFFIIIVLDFPSLYVSLSLPLLLPLPLTPSVSLYLFNSVAFLHR